MSSGHTHAENPHLAHHFHTIEQQRESATLGMWLFLAQEMMFFGGLFTVYAVYRGMYTDAWTVGSHQLSVFWGGLNTVVLLLSSFSMAMGVYYTQIGRTKNLVKCLLITLALGIAFVVIKLIFEWAPKYEYGLVPGAAWGPDPHHYPDAAAFAQQGHLHMFYVLYFIMTGMHALHMVIGFLILIPLILMSLAGKFGPERFMPIENFGLYWHFVDIVWVFLFPLFYLVR